MPISACCSLRKLRFVVDYFLCTLDIFACKYRTMSAVTWDEIRRLRADFLNLQLTESANKYVKVR